MLLVPRLAQARSSFVRANWSFGRQRPALAQAFATVALPHPTFMTRQMSTSAAAFRGATTKELQTWLEQRGVDTCRYGTGLAKTVQELLEEMQRQESVLEDDAEGRGAVRIVRVLSLHITNADGMTLYEDEQVLPDGRSRRRDVLLSEKLVGPERWQDAAYRAVAEELGTVLPKGYEVVLLEDTYRYSSEVSNSMSYPGLQTKYIFHRVAAKVTGLPHGPFSTSEPRPTGRLLTHWVWRDGVCGTDAGCRSSSD